MSANRMVTTLRSWVCSDEVTGAPQFGQNRASSGSNSSQTAQGTMATSARRG